MARKKKNPPDSTPSTQAQGGPAGTSGPTYTPGAVDRPIAAQFGAPGGSPGLVGPAPGGNVPIGPGTPPGPYLPPSVQGGADVVGFDLGFKPPTAQEMAEALAVPARTVADFEDSIHQHIQNNLNVSAANVVALLGKLDDHLTTATGTAAATVADLGQALDTHLAQKTYSIQEVTNLFPGPTAPAPGSLPGDSPPPVSGPAGVTRPDGPIVPITEQLRPFVTGPLPPSISAPGSSAPATPPSGTVRPGPGGQTGGPSSTPYLPPDSCHVDRVEPAGRPYQPSEPIYLWCGDQCFESSIPGAAYGSLAGPRDVYRLGPPPPNGYVFYGKGANITRDGKPVEAYWFLTSDGLHTRDEIQSGPYLNGGYEFYPVPSDGGDICPGGTQQTPQRPPHREPPGPTDTTSCMVCCPKSNPMHTSTEIDGVVKTDTKTHFAGVTHDSKDTFAAVDTDGADTNVRDFGFTITSGWDDPNWCPDPSTAFGMLGALSDVTDPKKLWKAIVEKFPDPSEGPSQSSFVNQFVNTLIYPILSDIFKSLTGVALSSFKGSDCYRDLPPAGFISRFIINLVNQYLGNPLRELQGRYDNTFNFTCQSVLPSAAEANQAYLSGTISKDTWECWTKAAGHYVNPAWNVLQSNRLKFSPLDLTTLYRRNKFNVEEYVNRVRELGYLRDDDATELLELTQQIPPITDLIRFMVRDAADKKLSEKFGLDTDFDKKWVDPIKTFGDWQGIHPDYARLSWRAHWTIPAPGQLFQMYRRLRHSGKFGSAEALLDDIQTALEQQDILPFWIPLLLEISFNPLTRVDARRAYNLGLLSDKDMLQVLYAQGYDDEDAQRLLRFANRQRRDAIGKHAWIKLFLQGGVSREETASRLVSLGFPGDEVNEAIEEAVALDDAKAQAECAKAVRAQFLKGEIDERTAREDLESFGVDGASASKFVSRWYCLRKSRGRSATPAALCQWYQDGLIDGVEYSDRMERLGWDSEDISRFLEVCDKSRTRKLSAAELKAQREKQREIDKQRRDEEKLARQRAQKARQAAAAAQRLNNYWAQVREATAKAIEQFSKDFNYAPADATAILGDTKRQIMKQYGYGDKDAVKVIVTAMGDWDQSSGISFRDWALDYARLATDAASSGAGNGQETMY